MAAVKGSLLLHLLNVIFTELQEWIHFNAVMEAENLSLHHNTIDISKAGQIKQKLSAWLDTRKCICNLGEEAYSEGPNR